MAYGRSMELDASPISPNGSAPRCQHRDGLAPVAPQPGGCQACQAQQDRWAALLFCLTCGLVACSDDSPNRHAKAHYEETDHPLATRLAPGSRLTWCYVHQRLV